MARWHRPLGNHHDLVCRDCFVRVSEPADAVLDDDAPLVRFMSAHAGHNVSRRARLPKGWSVIDGEGGLPEAA